ncbi:MULTISPECIES: 3'(2'),5'-bisphosphate nucleotidase CysQ [unclassified Aureimonas]|uniref:3'(2'),5'-bisphosphate nucleotidase CysQ n=1 Tax=unclassified Aureimonas TaxID=2615206 RepID=UPI0006FE24E0|nr:MULTISPECIES: 3'(2'),5'-bisphosphate nucleotidase CysQ [unclassified Aureimonas]KQT66297.1 hypothetical protein ASG62_19635 [Aureimonas sp. Leaf427]KQT72479.1 hypothetical protein ASG54_04005 [Aureimonas sp. Leaf460]
MTRQDDPGAVLCAFQSAALEAAALVRGAFGGEREHVLKADFSPVTEADLAAETLIKARLAEAFPDLPVVAEEAVYAGDVPAHLGRRFVLVDPIDGTREFIGGIGDFTVNIALIEDGRPVAGVVVAPAYGEIFVGSAAGAFKGRVGSDGRSGLLHTIETRKALDHPIVLVSRSRAQTPDVAAFLMRYRTAEVVPVGSSLKFCRIAEGAADLYPCFGRTMEWDTAAGQAVLEAAGGTVRTLGHAPLLYEKRGRAGEADFANPYFVASGVWPLPSPPGPPEASPER